MPRLSRTLLCLALFLLTAGRAVAEPVATLVTVGPGDAVWEKFGHNMIRIQDDDRGLDVCFNWGLFNFDQPNFIGNFVRGRMLYTMAPIDSEPLLDEYKQQDRRVTFQRLRLSPQQARDLFSRCVANYRNNPDYRYDYFKDNCSTRVRDMLDAATGGAFARAMKGQPTQPAVSFRSESVRLLQGDFWASLGMDFAMGPQGDKPLDAWAAGFVPERVAETAKAFAEPPTEPWTSSRALPPPSPPTRWPGLMAVGLAIAAGVVWTTRWPRKIVVGVWWLLSGFGGLFMLYMWLFTDHAAAHVNQNLWHFSPLAWLALGAAMIRRRRLAAKLAVCIAVLSIVGAVVWTVGRLGGPFAQANGGFVLFALPINLAIAWAQWPCLAKASLTKAAAADDMAG